jgi:hypothetical protein
VRSNKRLKEYLQEQENLKREKRGRERMTAIPPLKYMGALRPAAKSRCWRQNLKVFARRAKTLPQDEEQWGCTCADPERGEAEEGQRQRRR